MSADSTRHSVAIVLLKPVLAAAVATSTSEWSDAVGVSDLRSGGPADAAGYIRIGSVTRTFVATVLLQLVDEGRLSLDDPIERHLPAVVPGGERTSSVRRA